MPTCGFMRLATFATSFALVAVPVADACTRFSYRAGDSGFLVGRSMDWPFDTEADLWTFPAGLERDGGVGEDSLTWTSKYGSVVVSFYDSYTVDGMNEAGLVGNHLVLAEADYGDPDASDRPLMSLGAELQYILDNFATVDEAVEALSTEPYQVVQGPVLIGATTPPLEVTPHGHIALTDPTGDNAILEWIDGKLTIYHSPEYTVMTNSPPFDEQLAINTYWEDVGGMSALPGTHRAADRFVRTTFNLKAVPQVEDLRQAAATVFSLIRHISVPLGITNPDLPNLSSTQYRTVADIPQRRYYYEGALNQALFWVDLEKLDLSEGAPVMNLDLRGFQILAGEVSDEFEPADPFEWAPP